MSVIGSNILAGASGAAGGDKVYVDDVFSTYVYDGNSSDQPINNGIDLAGEGGLVWIKKRDTSGSHSLTDTVTGIDKNLISNSTNAQATDAYRITAVSANGFTLHGDGTNVNTNGDDFVSWTFRKAPGWCDIVTWTGNSTARTISHQLGSVPGMIIVKVTSGGTDDWFVYHRSLGDQRIKLNSTNASGSTAVWNYTAPTSSVFSVGTDGGVNGSGRTYVAYIFAHDDAQFGTDGDESIIKCGSYTGTNAENIINVGFEPQYFFIKRTDSAGLWMCWDVMRGAANNSTNQPSLYFTSSDAESPFGQAYVHQNGFAFSNSDTDFNASGGTYIYMAIRRPNKPPEVATDVFALTTASNDNYTTFLTSGFPVDLVIEKGINGFGTYFWSRVIGASQFLDSTSTAVEGGNRQTVIDSNTQFTGFGGLQTAAGQVSFYALKRAPGFMDVVAFTGTGSATTINHNLGAVPSVVLIKGRDTTYNWYWQHYALGANTWLQLNKTEAGAGNGGVFNSTLPTSSVFSVGGLAGANGSGNTYIAYLFGDLPEISKAGTYTGTGSALNIDCGFTNGARFVLIKRTDSTGNWYVFDTARGIVSGNDFAFAFNSTASQISGDYIDPLPAGFTINGSYAQWNESGGTYIFLAIA
jgi:hypothetical protein